MLKRVLLFCIISGLPLTLYAASYPITKSHWGVDGNVGLLQVHGTLTQSACRMDLSSRYQSIDLGDISTTMIDRPENNIIPKIVVINLRDCINSNTLVRDVNTSNQLLGIGQPSVAWRIIAATESKAPQLVKVDGARGIGLSISDSHHRALDPGPLGKPELLMPGQDSLKFYITPKRTPGLLIPGIFYSTLYVYFTYN